MELTEIYLEFDFKYIIYDRFHYPIHILFHGFSYSHFLPRFNIM